MNYFGVHERRHQQLALAVCVPFQQVVVLLGVPQRISRREEIYSQTAPTTTIMAEMKDVVGSLLGRWAVPALKLIQIVSFDRLPPEMILNKSLKKNISALIFPYGKTRVMRHRDTGKGHAL